MKVTAETKFDIGDKVHVIDDEELYAGKTVTVEHITVTIFDGDEALIEYTCEVDNGFDTFLYGFYERRLEAIV